MNHEAIKILLVEDSPGDVRLIHESLKSTSHGEFALTHAERLAEALQRLDAEPFDAVLQRTKSTIPSPVSSWVWTFC